MLKQAAPDVIKWQVEIFNLLPASYCPKFFDVRDDRYWYSWIDGDHNLNSTDLLIIKNICSKYIWSHTDDIDLATKETNIHNYMVYCYTREPELMPYILKDMVTVDQLNFTKYIHGDLTVENIIKTEAGSLILIDPSPPRNLSCIELDESKLLQSILTGWEAVKRLDKFVAIEPPFNIRPVHIALLLTHWIRLYAHPEMHTDSIIRAAGDTIEALTKFCKEIKNDNCTLRYRWCLDRLKKLGVPGLSRGF